jgi:hypothetical protein
VKPAAEKLKTYPNIYLPNTTIHTKIDFSDLEDAVMPFLLSNSKARRRIRDAHLLLKKYSKVDTVAKDVSEFLVNVLQRPTTYDPRGCYPSPTWFFDTTGIRKPSLMIRHIAEQRLRQGEPLYDPDPTIDANEIMDQLGREEALRRAGMATVHEVSEVPLVDVSSRHIEVLESYSHIVHSADHHYESADP